MVFGSSSSSWCTLLVVSFVVLMVMFAGAGEAMPPPICTDQKLPLSPYAQKLCAALNNISEFSRAMEEYLDAKAIKNSMPINEPEVKRQDLDHVFLRFGRSQ
nr:myosuppressin-like precursor [Palaemon carinicauda]